MNYIKSAVKNIMPLFAISIVTTLILGGSMVRDGLEKIVSDHFARPAICIQNNDYAPEVTIQEIELLAQTIYGEARGELNIPKYLKGVMGSVTTRAKKSGKSITEVILKKRINEKKGETHHYTCFDPYDVNYEKIKDLSNSQENEIWNKCYSLAEQALNNKLKLPEVTNYFVGKNPKKYKTKKQAEKMRIPSWAYKMENGNFVLDKNKKRIPIEPNEIVKIDKNKSAYFYNFKYF